MAGTRPATIAAYIRNAPRAAQPHLHRLYDILKQAAPEATEAIKWGVPYFVEPRFLFSFAAFKHHLVFAPSADALAAFRADLAGHHLTKNFLQVPYDEPLPDDLIRRMAAYRVKVVGERDDDSFW